MSAVETCNTWRDEIATELQETEAQLTTARAALEAAETAQRAAKATWIALEGFTAGLQLYNPADGLTRTESLCGPLYARLQEAHQPVTAAGAVSARARGDVAALVRRVTDLRAALAQLDRLLTTANVAAISPPVAPARRRIPAVVDFDNIVRSREGATP
jgi:hypothetical protein